MRLPHLHRLTSSCFAHWIRNFKERARVLAQVTHRVAQISGEGSEKDQRKKINEWARRARPTDYETWKIRGFALSGFQYLRILFGANTCKPDLRIRQWVGAAVGHKVSDIVALRLMEKAALEAGVSLRHADAAIWQMIARGSKGWPGLRAGLHFHVRGRRWGSVAGGTNGAD